MYLSTDSAASRPLLASSANFCATLESSLRAEALHLEKTMSEPVKYPTDATALAAWTQAAAKSAPGGKLEALNWITPEGISVKPLYTAAMTLTIRASPATSARPAWPSTRSRT